MKNEYFLFLKPDRKVSFLVLNYTNKNIVHYLFILKASSNIISIWLSYQYVQILKLKAFLL